MDSENTPQKDSEALNAALTLFRLNRALSKNPRNEKAWTLKGDTLLKLGKKKEAVAAYEELLRINPRNATGWGKKGAALYSIGQNQDALSAYDEALEINPRNELAWSNKGIILSAVGRKQDALLAYETALEINPLFAMAWAGKALCLIAFKRMPESLSAFDMAINIDPRNELAWYNKAVLLANMFRREESLAAVETALQINPRSENAWSHKGIVLSNLGRREEGLAAQEQALAINPRFGAAWFHKGIALSHFGRKEEALIAFDMATQINPRNGEVWFHRGMLLTEGLGRHADALSSFEEAQSLGYEKAAFGISACRLRLAPPAPTAPLTTPKATPQPGPAKVQIREDARTFRQFYPNAALRHTVHHAFAHQFLPQYVFQNPTAFFSYIFTLAMEPTRFIQSRWMMYETNVGLFKEEKDIVKNGMIFRRVTDLAMEPVKIEEHSIALVCMPPPEQPLEAFFVAVVLPVARVFTLEAFATTNPQIAGNGVICEWMSGGEHRNFGRFVPPERDAFLKAVIDLLRNPDAPVMAGFIPPTTVPNPEAPAMAADRFHCGMESAKALRWAEALGDFDYVLHMNPNHAETWFRRAMALIALQRTPEALISLQKAAQLGNKDAGPQLNYWQRKMRAGLVS